MLSFEQIKELATLVADTGLDGIELERTGFRLSIHGRPAAEGIAAQAPAAFVESPPAVAAAAEAGDDAESDPLAEAHILHSPIVGTFYVAPSPEADPFVQVGDAVKKGQVVCIVEAMKLMNEIEADIDGEILHVYPKNAQPVEYGEPLFAIRPR